MSCRQREASRISMAKLSSIWPRCRCSGPTSLEHRGALRRCRTKRAASRPCAHPLCYWEQVAPLLATGNSHVCVAQVNQGSLRIFCHRPAIDGCSHFFSLQPWERHSIKLHGTDIDKSVVLQSAGHSLQKRQPRLHQRWQHFAVTSR